MNEYAGATPPASPTPTPIRARKIWVKLWVAPHSAVKALHTSTAIAMMLRRELRSANHAIGSASVVYSRAKAVPYIRPNCESLSENSLMTDGPRIAKI